MHTASPASTIAAPASAQPYEQVRGQRLPALPSDWIDRLFGRLEEFYGARFADMWQGLEDPDHPGEGLRRIKATWGRSLALVTAEQLRDALELCSKRNQFPPTLPEFMQMCQASRRNGAGPRIEHQPVKDASTDAARAECMALLGKLTTDKPRGLNWAERLRDRHASGERLSVVQVQMYQAAMERRRDSGQTGSEATRSATLEPYS